jgi:hypothetical protein
MLKRADFRKNPKGSRVHFLNTAIFSIDLENHFKCIVYNQDAFDAFENISGSFFCIFNFKNTRVKTVFKKAKKSTL